MRMGLSSESSANCPNEKTSEAPILCLWMLQLFKFSMMHQVVICADGPAWLQCRYNFPPGLVKL